MADTIAIVAMVVAFILLLVAFIRLFPDLVAEARADAAAIRAAETRARHNEAGRQDPPG